MLTPSSRYFSIEITKLMTPGGREIVYLRRRFLPPACQSTIVAEYEVTQGERLDHITARFLSDPELLWRLCDSNNALHPDELTGEIGRRLSIPLLA
jgi:hypothetical protein